MSELLKEERWWWHSEPLLSSDIGFRITRVTRHVLQLQGGHARSKQYGKCERNLNVSKKKLLSFRPNKSKDTNLHPSLNGVQGHLESFQYNTLALFDRNR